MKTALHHLDEETSSLRGKVEATIARLLQATSGAEYARSLGHIYGFVAPLERCLLDTTGLSEWIDIRRFRKHMLLEHDLSTLGLDAVDIQAVPQCLAVPLFEHVESALGWAYVIERNTLAHPTLFRHLASSLPGEAAFASSYLKCYAGQVGEMWQSFADAIERCAADPVRMEKLAAGAKAGYRTFRGWRNALDGHGNTIVEELIRPLALSLHESSGDAGE